MSTASIRSALRWASLPLPADPLAGQSALHYADVGETGPLAVISCGIHGDEGPWSALAVQQLLEQPLAQLSGRLRLVLAANPTAVAADARNSPLDQLDLNRSFPGNRQGSHSEYLAAALLELFQGCNTAIDLHGGGSWCVNAFTFRFPGSEFLADAVGAPFVVDLALRSGHLAGQLAEQGANIVAIEMGGRSVDELLWRDRLAQGIGRALAAAGVLTSEFPRATVARPVQDMLVLRPRSGGVFVPAVRQEAIGSCVAGGSTLGTVHHLGTMEPIETLTAPYDETALLLLRPHITVLEGGAMTFVVARPS